MLVGQDVLGVAVRLALVLVDGVVLGSGVDARVLVILLVVLG